MTRVATDPVRGNCGCMTRRELIEQLREARRQARGLEQTFDRLLEAAEKPENDTEEWIDQDKSGLGPRRHCAVVRLRMKEGKPGAARVGRRYLLSPAAFAEERGHAGRATLARCAPPAAAEAEEEAAYRALVQRLEP